VAITLAAAASALAADTIAAVDVFLKLSGIKGESEDKDHKAEIEVLNWSWNMLGETRKPGCASELSATKRLDVSTPQLMQAMAVGRVLPDATLKARRPGEGSKDHLFITMTGVSVLQVSPGGSSNGETFEQLTLAFDKATIKYEQQGSDGSIVAITTATVDGCRN
jgi:type VI secretion system secreted protein Hcp